MAHSVGTYFISSLSAANVLPPRQCLEKQHADHIRCCALLLLLLHRDITVCDHAEDDSQLRGEGLGVQRNPFSQGLQKEIQGEQGMCGSCLFKQCFTESASRFVWGLYERRRVKVLCPGHKYIWKRRVYVFLNWSLTPSPNTIVMSVKIFVVKQKCF